MLILGPFHAFMLPTALSNLRNRDALRASTSTLQSDDLSAKKISSPGGSAFPSYFCSALFCSLVIYRFIFEARLSFQRSPAISICRAWPPFLIFFSLAQQARIL